VAVFAATCPLGFAPLLPFLTIGWTIYFGIAVVIAFLRKRYKALIPALLWAVGMAFAGLTNSLSAPAAGDGFRLFTMDSDMRMKIWLIACLPAVLASCWQSVRLFQERGK
jgi:hypothetical protein